jgi:hypothetical protein
MKESNLIPMPQTSNWKKEHGSWEGFCEAVHRSIGRKLGSGVITFIGDLNSPLTYLSLSVTPPVSQSQNRPYEHQENQNLRRLRERDAIRSPSPKGERKGVGIVHHGNWLWHGRKSPIRE